LISVKELDRTNSFSAEEFAGLIFDCDGTLTDSMPLHYEAWRTTMARYGIAFAEEQFYALGGIPSFEIVRLLAAEHSLELNSQLVAEQKENHFISLMDSLQPIEAVCEIARRSFQKRPISVASGGTRELIHAQLERVSLKQYFEIVVCAEDTEKHKPHPDVFLEAARRMKIAPQDCCVFEDSPLGIEAARRAGMCFVDIRYVVS